MAKHPPDKPCSLAPPTAGFDAASEAVLTLTPREQMALWTALEEPVPLTPAQEKLGALMRGKSVGAVRGGDAGG